MPISLPLPFEEPDSLPPLSKMLEALAEKRDVVVEDKEEGSGAWNFALIGWAPCVDC